MSYISDIDFFIGLAFMFDNGIYSDDIFNLTKLKAFYVVISLILVFTGIPLLINIVLLIVLQLKVKKLYCEEMNLDEKIKVLP
ncbi:hypothetical protein [Longibaculum muris]|uniref:hypothetical protein n=1 Tax=Longibaculum muris TaxID=1796628 RepID=UPI003AB16D9D